MRRVNPARQATPGPSMRRLASLHSRGFSLVELIVVFAITALLLATAVPSLGTWMRNAQIRNAAESLQGGLNRARMEAVRRNGNVRFSLVSTNASKALDSSCALSNTSPSWVVSVQSPAGKCDVAPSDTTAPMTIEKWARNDGAASVSVSVLDATCSAASTATSVTYDGYGRLAPNTTPIRCIEITHANSSTENRPLRIMIGASTVRMCDPSTSLSATDPRKC
jgi:type IV fimbrial biogenesis protein FimT